MTTPPFSLNQALLEAQSEFQAVIAAACEDIAPNKVAEMAFITADVCILCSETPERLSEDQGKHLRSALRAMAGIFRTLEKASLQTAAESANKLSAACAKCETAIYSFLEDTAPNTWEWRR